MSLLALDGVSKRFGGITAVDQVSFHFSKIEVEYKAQKPDGSLAVAAQFKYDLKSNKVL